MKLGIRIDLGPKGCLLKVSSKSTKISGFGGLPKLVQCLSVTLFCKQHKYILNVSDLNETWYTDRTRSKGVPFGGFVRIRQNLWIWRAAKTRSILPVTLFCKQYKYLLNVSDLNKTWCTDRSRSEWVSFKGFV